MTRNRSNAVSDRLPVTGSRGSPKIGSHRQQRNAPTVGLHLQRQQPILPSVGNQEMLRAMYSEGAAMQQMTEELDPSSGPSRRGAYEQFPSTGAAAPGNESGGFIPQQSGAQEPRNSNGQYIGRLPGSENEKNETEVEEEQKRKRMPAERMSAEFIGKDETALDITDKDTLDEDGEDWPDFAMLAAALEMIGYSNRGNSENAEKETAANANRARKNGYLAKLLGAAGKSKKKDEASSSGSSSASRGKRR